MNKKNKNYLYYDDLIFLYGIPHCHSNLSTGEGSIIDLLTLAYKNSLDFIFITDHNDYINKNLNNSISKWQTLIKTIRKFNKHNNFIALSGFEAKTSELGHFNIINTKSYFKGVVKNFNDMLIWMLKENPENVLISINHPHKYVDNIPLNVISNNYIRTIEVGNGIYNNKYTNHESFYYNLLDKGWHLAPINSQDNHKLNLDKAENLTCAITKSFNKDALLEAFRKLRVFSTESKSLKLYFTINSTFMGSTLTISEKEELNFFINVDDNIRKISKVEILSNNRTTVKEFKDINLHSVKILFNKKINIKENWYVIKITLIDKRVAVSSPIFLEVSPELEKEKEKE
ncbi:CehA/McbA family metallohydrolase [Clostridium massiliamazoniense]|uniref:CehA/McbA family metallohydrolase n=1 Tax=Clostridium massiliamazoniense TaxID=1347366 RepID=UPI0006D78665|nr:CehA/McbA family metallohydrolase [Clostridium massiliamazoniense]